MPKSCDVSPELRDFNSVFSRLTRVHDESTVFQDWLICMTNFFSALPKDINLSRYTLEERLVFPELMHSYLLIFQRQVADGGWYDGLGDFYMAVSSSSKHSAMGQFFTPVDICTMMAGLTEKTKAGSFVNDPACGSGRCLIAHHMQNAGCFYFGEDLDSICCRMTALNMMLHGIRGEVININSLSRDDYRIGWRINPFLGSCGIPCIQEISASQSYSFSGYVSPVFRSAEVNSEGTYVPQKVTTVGQGSFTF